MRLKKLGISVHLVRKEQMEREFERLPYEPMYDDILGIPVRKVVIAVDAGCNLAVLVEAAVRNTIPQRAVSIPTRNSSSATRTPWPMGRARAVGAVVRQNEVVILREVGAGSTPGERRRTQGWTCVIERATT